MDMLFLVPTLVSNTVNEKLVPALAKMIERNIILNNAALFKKALQINYKYKKSIIPFFDGYTPIFMIGDGVLTETDTLFETYCGNILTEAKKSQEEIDWERERDQKKRNLDSLKKQYDMANNRLDVLSDSFDKENDPVIKQRISDEIRYLYDITKELVVNYSNAMNDFTPYSQGYKQSAADAAREKLVANREMEKLNLDNSSLAQKMVLDSKKNKREEVKHKQEKVLRNLERMEKLLGLQYKPAEYETSIMKDFNSAIKTAEETKDIKLQRKLKLKAIDDLRKPISAVDKYRPTTTMTSLDQVEKPIDIHFFSQISLEPTILEIPLTIRVTRDPDADRESVNLRVGVKCVPYVVDNVKSIMSIMREARYMGMIERMFKNSIRKLNTKIWFTRARAINKGEIINPDESKLTIKYTPNMNELNNPKTLAKMVSKSGDASWSTMLVLSTYDFKDAELMDFIKNYRKMTKYVVGDLVITNETKESVYFCSPRFRNCIDIQFTYLQKVLNLSGVIDYSVVSRTSKAWRKETNYKNSTFKDALKENVEVNKNKELEKKLLEIIKG